VQEQKGLANFTPVPTKRITLIFTFIGLCFAAAAQINLVRNPSFESYVHCPSDMYEMDSSTTVFNSVSDWFAPNKSAVFNASPDYFNTCAPPTGFWIPQNVYGYQTARTGNGYTGILITEPLSSTITYREYIGSRLLQPLVANNHYLVTFYVSRANNLLASTDDIGLFFSSAYNGYPIVQEIPETPQIQNPSNRYLTDTIKWMKVSGSYQASGNEEWIIIGNFKSHANTTTQAPPGDQWGYYLIDDVSIANYVRSNTRKDTAICPGDLASIYMRPGFDSCIWNDGNTLSRRQTLNAGIYWVTSFFNDTLIYTDTFAISVKQLDTTSMDTGFCSGANLILTGRPAANQYNWNTTDISPSITISQSGTYWVTSQYGSSCIAMDTFHITEFPLPQITSLKDTLVCFDEVEQILLDAGKFKNYLWQPTGETTQTIYSTTALTYLLSVTDDNLCSAQKTVSVDESCTATLHVPNIFTPNNDKLNDVFKPVVRSAVDRFSISIINRWGEEVFHSVDINHGWDGKNSPEGVYIVYVTYSIYGKEAKSIRSTLTLLR
jgi:gliding motility-associated-like protein